MNKKDITRDMLEETHSNLLGLFETDEKAVLGDMSNREVKKDIMEMGEMIEEEDLPDITDEAQRVLIALGVVMPGSESEEEEAEEAEKVEVEKETEVEAEEDVKTEVEPEVEPDVEVEVEPEAVEETEPEVDVDVKTEVEPDVKTEIKSKGKKGPSATKQICILICENFEITNSEIEAKLNELGITCSKSTITTQGADTRRTITCLKELEKLN